MAKIISGAETNKPESFQIVDQVPPVELEPEVIPTNEPLPKDVQGPPKRVASFGVSLNALDKISSNPGDRVLQAFRFATRTPELMKHVSDKSVAKSSRHYSDTGRIYFDLENEDYVPKMEARYNKNSRVMQRIVKDMTKYYPNKLYNIGSYLDEASKRGIDMRLWAQGEAVVPIFYQPTSGSGVTLLDGIDLKAYNTEEKKTAFIEQLTKFNVSSDSIKYLRQFMGLSGDAAKNKLKEHYDLTGTVAQLPFEEMAKISSAFHFGFKIKEISGIFNNGISAINDLPAVPAPNQGDAKWGDLKDYWKTVYYYMGANFNRNPRFTQQLREGRYQDALNELADWKGDSTTNNRALRALNYVNAAIARESEEAVNNIVNPNPAPFTRGL